MVSGQAERWEARPKSARAVRVLAVVVPVVLAVAAGFAAAVVLGRPEEPSRQVLWLAAVFAVSGSTLIAFERLARRALPLATLFELSLVFPDRTPSRLGVALRAGLVRRPERRLAVLRHGAPATTLQELLSLIAALGSHDRRTRGHSERVRAFADVVAEELRLSAQDRDRLRWCALLHDIGKLEVEREVLQKDQGLDDAEWDQIRRHPEDGARIISSFAPWLGEWADAVAQHHERWDGKGYPLGLAGTEIALGARIVAVVDTFEVMTAGRSYCRAVSTAEARRELANCAGSQFDPAVVRAFLNAGLQPIGWMAGLAAWFGSLALVQRLRPDGLVGRVAQVGVTGGVAVAVTAAAIGGGPSLVPAAGAEVAGAKVAGVVFEQPDVEDSLDPIGLPPIADVPVPERAPVAAPAPARETPAPADAPPLTEVPPVERPPALLAPPVDPGAPPPVGGLAVPDAVVEASGGTRIDVLANDGGGRELDPTTLEILDPPDHSVRAAKATTTLVKNGTQVHYVPDPKFTGTDSFTYRVCTTDGECATTTVTITVDE